MLLTVKTLATYCPTRDNRSWAAFYAIEDTRHQHNTDDRARALISSFAPMSLSQFGLWPVPLLPCLNPLSAQRDRLTGQISAIVRFIMIIRYHLGPDPPLIAQLP